MTGLQLHRSRIEADVILGRDPFLTVLFRNAGKLIACDVWSRGFVWAVVSTWLMLAYNERNVGLSDVVHLSLGAHAVLAWLHWAARDQFKEAISALCDTLRSWKGAPRAPEKAAE